MFKIFKYLKLMGSLRSAQDAYKKAKDENRPWYMSREFRGALIILIGAGLSIHFGVKIDENILGDVTESLEKIIAASIVLYGAAMEIVGVLKRKK